MQDCERCRHAADVHQARDLAKRSPASGLLWSGRMLSLTQLAVGPRVELQLDEQAALQQRHELGDFVRFCIAQIERDAGPAAWWKVTLAPQGVCYSCEVIVEHRGVVVHASGNGFDAAVAGRDAFCKLDRILHETRIDLVRLGSEVACATR